MKKILFAFLSCALATGAEASWYWPFGSSEEEVPRVADLVEKASRLIGDASDLVAEGKVTDAVQKYKEALEEIDRVEAENPERAKTQEFATLKTKRAYVEATIDALLMNQARQNAKPVAVSDTTALEKRLAAERNGGGSADGAVVPAREEPKPERKAKPKKAERKSVAPARPLTKREAVAKAIGDHDFAKADLLIAEMLEAKPNDATALNLRAAREAAEGKFREAEKTLDTAIQSNPRDYHAYYNMALLKLQSRQDDHDGARRYYENARLYGCPQDPGIEELLK